MLARLRARRQRIAALVCAEYGHKWRWVSHPVLRCTRCKITAVVNR